MATFFKNYGELNKTVKNLVEQYKQAKIPENVVRRMNIPRPAGMV